MYDSQKSLLQMPVGKSFLDWILYQLWKVLSRSCELISSDLMIQIDTFAVKEKTCSVQNEDPSLFLFEANFSFLFKKAMAVNFWPGWRYVYMNEWTKELF